MYLLTIIDVLFLKRNVCPKIYSPMTTYTTYSSTNGISIPNTVKILYILKRTIYIHIYLKMMLFDYKIFLSPKNKINFNMFILSVSLRMVVSHEVLTRFATMGYVS